MPLLGGPAPELRQPQALARSRLSAPKFAQYPASVYFGTVGRLDLSSPEAFSYRTRLRAASQGPINFAGLFQIATWGRGTDCATGAIIDAFTGRVTFLPSVSTERMEAVTDAAQAEAAKAAEPKDAWVAKLRQPVGALQLRAASAATLPH
jgi:hypothetical protein